MTDIPITSTNRGFHIYGDPVDTGYGAEITVYESSAAMGPHVWLAVTPGSVTPDETGQVTAHLDIEAADAVIARLQAWRDEVPDRWEGYVRPMLVTTPAEQILAMIDFERASAASSHFCLPDYLRESMADILEQLSGHYNITPKVP